jgi:hypothetical protein
MILIVGQDRFNAFKAGTATPTDAEKQKLQTCFANYTTTAPSGATVAPPPKAPSEDKTACIVSVVGQTRFDALKTSGFQFTAEEKAALTQKCFPVTEKIVSTVAIAPPPGFKEDSPVMKCFKDAIGVDRFTAIISGKSRPTSDEEVKGKACFGGPGSTAYNKHIEKDFPTDLKACLAAAVGEDRFKAISAGGAPTTDERKKGENCFKSTGHAPVINPPTGNDDTKPVECAKIALGETRFAAISSGSPITLEERQKVETCLGAEVHPIAPPSQVSMSTDLVNCLKKAIGEDRFTSISSGKSFPTTTEQQAGAACFKTERGKITNPEVKKVVAAIPTAGAAVPYLREDSALVTVEVQRSIYNGGTTVNGVAAPNAIVDIYVYSDPVMKSVQADGGGKWSYDLNNADLPQGDHTVIAAVNSGDEVVRSTAVALSLQAPTTAPDDLRKYALAGGGALAVLLSLGFWWSRRMRKPTPIPTA